MSPVGRRTAVPRTLLLAALLAAAGCSYSKKQYYIPSPLPIDSRDVSVTVTTCDCDHCRLQLVKPVNGKVVYEQVDPVIGVEFIAVPCYVDLGDSSGPRITATLECGSCPGPGSCGASAIVGAGGVAFSLVPPPSPPPGPGPNLSCTTVGTVGAACRDEETLWLDATPTAACSP